MPTLDKFRHDWSPRQTLLARCPVCIEFVNWHHDRDNPGNMNGSCCGLAFIAKYNGDPPREWSIFVEKADMRNVTVLYEVCDDGGVVDEGA